MKPPIQELLLVAVLTQTVGEVLGAGHFKPMTQASHCDDDPPEAMREICLIERHMDLPLHRLSIVSWFRP
ncbi:MAG TPA: hypothetical protein VGT82_06335, partial [Ktedonobacteraceae bacterium]|nr:hypothetical protein [Ktedonobacteraceae bacterium]